jgi:hypothetical protein
VSDPFDYSDPKALEFELDLPPGQPARRSATPEAPGAKPPIVAPPSPATELDPDDFFELPEPLTSTPPPGIGAASEAPAEEPFALELEDIARPVATDIPRMTTPVRSPPILLPKPAVVPHAPPVRTLELRVAESVDRMPSFTRGSLLALTIVSMVLLAVVAGGVGMRNAAVAMDDMRRAAGLGAAEDAARYSGDLEDDDYDDGEWD